MTVFQQFRLWLRRAPRGERALAAVAAALVLALAGWLLVPPHTSGNAALQSAGQPGGASSGSTVTQGGGGSTTAGQSGAAGPGSVAAGSTRSVTGPAGRTGGTGSAPAATAAAGSRQVAGGRSASCTSPPGTDQGVTAGQMNIAIILINLVGQAGNSAFGLPQPAIQQKWFQDVIDATNASGGIACRKVAPVYYQGNPADATNLQQLCLEVAQAKPFFVIDLGAYTVNPDIATCYPKAGLPFRTSSPLPSAQVQQYYPYLFSTTIAEMRYRNTVFGLKQRGFFAQGFSKLGVIYRDCVQQVPSQYFSWLQQAGIPKSAVVSYDFGCPSSGFASPSDIQQAIIKFKQAGVTHMTEFEDTGDFPNFTNIAQQQQFTPKWGIPDDGVVATTYGTQQSGLPEHRQRRHHHRRALRRGAHAGLPARLRNQRLQRDLQGGGGPFGLRAVRRAGRPGLQRPLDAQSRRRARSGDEPDPACRRPAGGAVGGLHLPRRPERLRV